jgi:hypothetical protein
LITSIYAGIQPQQERYVCSIYISSIITTNSRKAITNNSIRMTPHRKQQTSEIIQAEGIEATTTFNSNPRDIKVRTFHKTQTNGALVTQFEHTKGTPTNN